MKINRVSFKHLFEHCSIKDIRMLIKYPTINGQQNLSSKSLMRTYSHLNFLVCCEGNAVVFVSEGESPLVR